MNPKYDRATLERMVFRRQFVLGPASVDRFPSWQKLDLGAGLKLTVHPDLGVERARRGEAWAVLLGYALDSHNPRASNLDILHALLDALHTSDDLLEATDRLGGRWILIAHDGTRTIVLTDAAGMRQVFYTRGSPGDALWCASQPGLLAELLGLTVDAAAAAFMKTARYASDTNASTWYPGDTTPFDRARLLLPNHYLHLESGRVSRCWPRKNLEPIPLDEAVPKCLRSMRGLMSSARGRFAMSVAMTAGWDSRLVLAASRNIAREMTYFTGIFWNMAPDHRDAASPTRLLSALGFENNLIPCRSEPSEEFLRIFRRNVVTAHPAYAAVAEGMLDERLRDRVCTKGDVAEIVKCYFRLDKSLLHSIDAHDLAALAEMDPHPFVIAAFEEWLGGARPFNVDLLDLFCWEQSMGSQEAMIQAECDLVQESFSPLNCRELLTTMLSVDEKHRRPPTFELFRALIKEQWPELLNEPINDEAQTGAKSFARRAIMKMDVDRMAPRSVRRFARRLLS